MFTDGVLKYVTSLETSLLCSEGAKTAQARRAGRAARKGAIGWDRSYESYKAYKTWAARGRTCRGMPLQEGEG